MTPYLIRIVNLDWYMCTPIQGLDVVYSEFRGTLINQVPVLRVFGSTQLGKKICVHIHGVFPYFYIPYDGSQEINSLMYQIATSIDKAVNVSLNQSSSNTQHVYKISLVSGIPMYGYHNKKHQFLKVCLYNPMLIRKVSTLITNETTLGKLYQPHETHLSFPLQFMIDYNLHGMSNLVLSDIKFRMDPGGSNQDISPDLFLPASINKLTVCELEADAFAEHIINRKEVASGNIAVNPGIAALWEDERQRRRNKGETSQIEHLLELTRINIEPTKSHKLYKQALLERLAILSTDKPTEEKVNLSVYPAESPDDINIQNASIVDLHTTSSRQLSLDDLNITSSGDLDDTLLSTQQSDLSLTMDAEAQKLLEILERLGENVKEDVEDDCILTQVAKEDEEEEDKYLDLSMPLESITTPKKIFTNKDDVIESDEELSYDLNKTLIPQLDGEWDSADEDELHDPALAQSNTKSIVSKGTRLIKKALYIKLINMDVKRGKNMPLLDIDAPLEETRIFKCNSKTTDESDNCKSYNLEKFNGNIVDTLKMFRPEEICIEIPPQDILQENDQPLKRKCVRTYVRKSPHVKLQEELKTLGNRVKKMKRQDQLIRIIRKFHAKEHNICVLLSKTGKPRFNVISKDMMLAQYSGKKKKPLSEVPEINNMLYQTRNYIDPDLHLMLQCSRENYLYNYNKNIYPNVINIPNNLTEPGKETMLNSFVKEHIPSLKEISPETQTNLWMYESYEDYSSIDLENEIFSSVLFDDLPEILKLSIGNIASTYPDIVDRENNNYINDICLTKSHKPLVEEKNTDTDSQLKSEYICNENNDLKNKLIDADNKENIYIFSSKYLTDIKANNLQLSNKNPSVTQLKESVDTIKAQLQKHIVNLNKPVSPKNSTLTTEERNKILNNVLDNDNIKDTQINCVSFNNKENIKHGEFYKNNLLYANRAPNIFNTRKENKEFDVKFDKKAAMYNLSLIDKFYFGVQNKPNTVDFDVKTCKCKNLNYMKYDCDKNTTIKNCDTRICHERDKEKLSRPIIIVEDCDKAQNKNHKSRKITTTDIRDGLNPENNSTELTPESVNTRELRRSARINSPTYKQTISKNNALSLSFFDSDFSSTDSSPRKPSGNKKKTRTRKNNAVNTQSHKKVTKELYTNVSKLFVEKNHRPNAKDMPVLCLSWDGANDSSSSEEEGSNKFDYRRQLRKRTNENSTLYKALPISVGSPRTRSPYTAAGKRLVSLNTNTNSEKKKTQVNLNKSKQTVCDINVKRRLSFSNITSLQTTLVEEKLVCTFSPRNQKKHIVEENSTQRYKYNISQYVDKEIVSNKSNNDSLDSPKEHLIEDNSANSKDKLKCSNISQLSSSEDEMDRSFFKSPEIANKINLLLTTAEKYDKETNYSATEGTSRILTPRENPEVCSQRSSGESSGSSNFGMLTPYQRVVDKNDMDLSIIMEDNENKFNDNPEEIPDDIFSSGNSDNKHLFQVKSNVPVQNLSSLYDSLNSKYVITTPLKKSPSREEVYKTLDKYKIPHVKQEIPFYSNVEDVTGSVEIGYNVLKISSKTTLHLQEFESQTDSINKFRKLKLDSLSSNLQWRKSNIKNITLGFCKDRSCIITPAKEPPSVVVVKNWIKDKSKHTVTPVKKIERIKIFVPLSPGNHNDDDCMDISLTISPCTPKSSQPSQNTHYIPTTNEIITSESPVSEDKSTNHKRRLRKVVSQSSTPSFPKSLLLSQDKLSENQSFQITGVTVNNTYGFDKSIENLQDARALVEHEHLTLLVMELHTSARGELKPNPEYDSIRAIFYSVFNDVPDNFQKASKSKGIIVINSIPLNPDTSNTPILNGTGIDCIIDYVDSEENLINEFLKLIHYWDPDIIAGYEIEMLSWGYLIERAYILGKNLKPLLARAKENNSRFKDEDGQNELKITGRIVLDVWRLMRHEIALQSYTFESIVYHILHKRVPQYPFKDLSFWWDHRSGLYRHRTAHYYLFRVVTILELFDKLDLIGRTSELARLFGIQFYEVLSRGSQFRVESMMLRLAKPLNYIPVSPSVQQRAQMKAPEYIALVLEPESKLYNDPVIVLDFQSLYPSIIIAYNYCFTTCIGRVERLGKNSPFEFGATQLKISRKRLKKLVKKNLLNFSPCGVGYVKKEVRDGILPRMLREILDTRLMVKSSMKENRDNQILQKVLHNRQLGLKLIANVTYGYTAANFSGRMPSVEVGDSVVSKGRETLQRAIEMVENTPEWGARVVYGDTDSLFVLVPGRSRECAFEVGKKIADAVTKANPDPIKLKLEKVYQPCILQTKKRYVGYMYESPDQKEPVYDAKGIETVRRDGCPAVSKMLEKCLKVLFETKDISLVKKYVLRQFNKIIAGRASIQDLTFAKEYRGASGYRPGACVPALELARKWKAVDKRSEPRSGERVPYIIVSGPPGLPLIRLVRSPNDLLNDSSLRPNALYYITRVIIPPINRCFNLIGADLNTWFNQMPRKQLQYLPNSISPGKKSTISQYFSTTSCVACGEQTQMGICDKCNGNSQTTTITLMEKLKGWEEKCYTCNLICQSCTSSQTEIKCMSLDCPVLYQRIQTSRDVQQATYVRQLLCSSDFLF